MKKIIVPRESRTESISGSGHAMQRYFHKKGFALSLVLKVRGFGIRKSPSLGVIPWGVCKTRTGYLRMADADGENADRKMRMEKNADNKKIKKRKKREMRIFQIAITWLDPSLTYRT